MQDTLAMDLVCPCWLTGVRPMPRVQRPARASGSVPAQFRVQLVEYQSGTRILRERLAG
jgi:hypothetical protein